MKVLSISTDRNIFIEGSRSQERMREYGDLFDELALIVFSKKSGEFQETELSSNTIAYPTASRNRLFYIFNAFFIGKKILQKKEGKDFVVTVQDPFETGLVGLALSFWYKVPLHVQIHTDIGSSYFKRSFLNKLRLVIARIIIPRAYRVRVVSEKIKKNLVAMDIFPKERIDVLPIFIDSKKILTAPENTDFRSKYPQFGTIILIASRLEKEKNVLFSLKLINPLLNIFPHIGVIVVGDGRERKELEDFVFQSSLRGRVLFEGWQEDVLPYYHIADIFLQTSFYEGYGMSLVEAGGSGAAILTSDVGVAGELFKNGESAFVCDIKDEKCFSERMNELLRDEALRKRLGGAARLAVKNHISLRKEEYLERYKESLLKK